MVTRFIIPSKRSVGKSTDHCEHAEDGVPHGFPLFCCAWPDCPKGTPTEYWTIKYGPHGGLLTAKEFIRRRTLIDGVMHYHWEERE